MAKKDKIKVNYENLRTGDIVLTTGRGPFSRAIKTVTDSKVTHVGIVVNIYGFKVIAEMLGDGLVLNTFNRYTMSRIRGVVQVVRPLGLSHAQRSQIREGILKDWINHIDYDWGGVLKFVFKRTARNDKDEFFCSEYVAQVIFDQLGITDFDPGKIDPGELKAGHNFFPNKEIKWML